MPIFKRLSLDKKQEMKMIRAGEVEIQKAIEKKLKQKRIALLSKGYTPEQADVRIEEIKDIVSRKAIVYFSQQIRAAGSENSAQNILASELRKTQ